MISLTVSPAMLNNVYFTLYCLDLTVHKELLLISRLEGPQIFFGGEYDVTLSLF